eukprot:CAMPEP_0172328074 /NCGR_PEP_ID=MMETSP1058-20130122/60162_1 /TAXON_ID=83371 /ORGANISM="Detonula confervacea, Strain CCMP 353" /LENGTH=369 /DNA_ID=CAMNT_0013045171 /DNA_START=83 /DNA_END=1192 /DNA_ORIENTATION=+
MSTTIVFACKSNSCRSQMAEAWAQEWIKAERLGVENRTIGHIGDEDDRQLRAFLDGLMVVSVALDESSVANNEKSSMDTSISYIGTPLNRLSSSPTSSLTSHFEASSNSARQCVTCDGEMCTSTSQRRRPKEKAIQAMARDGVDISPYYAKTFSEVLPFVVSHHRRQTSDLFIKHQIDLGLKNWKSHLSFAGLRRVLESASREMGMAFAGIVRDDDRSESIAVEETDNERTSECDNTQIVDNLIVLCSCPASLKRQLSELSKETLDWRSESIAVEETDNERISECVVDNLIVLCSCPASLKRQLSELSKETLDWDIDPPTAAARAGEGDGAYLRVSRQIREKVHNFMNQMKRGAMLVDGDVVVVTKVGM